MTKYIAFKIFDSKLISNEDDFQAILRKQTDRYYTVVAEDYFEGIIKAGLEEIGKCEYCGGDAYEEPHYDCKAEHDMIARKESIADMEEAMGGAQEDYDD